MSRYHIGLRTVKTAIAVTIALFLAEFRGSPALIFAGIGAIVAMSRSLKDAVHACMSQIIGITCGFGMGILYVTFFSSYNYLTIGLGIILIITFCNVFKIPDTVTLSCIVFISICLVPANQSALSYGFNRLIDTSIGLITALMINILIKPYNNKGKILKMIEHLRLLFPDYIYERVLRGNCRDLSSIREKINNLQKELDFFKNQNPKRLLHRKELDKIHFSDCAYLMGCLQLLQKMYDELKALNTMDTSPMPDDNMILRLEKMGIKVPESAKELLKYGTDEDKAVQCFHLRNLLDANDFLCEILKEE